MWILWYICFRGIGCQSVCLLVSQSVSQSASQLLYIYLQKDLCFFLSRLSHLSTQQDHPPHSRLPAYNCCILFVEEYLFIFVFPIDLCMEFQFQIANNIKNSVFLLVSLEIAQNVGSVRRNNAVLNINNNVKGVFHMNIDNLIL